MSRPAGSAARPSAASTTIAATSRSRRGDWSRSTDSYEFLVCRFDGRRNQLDGILAIPFRRSGNGGDLASLAIDQHRGRHPQRPADGFKILKNLRFWVTEITDPGQIGLF